MVFEQKKIMSYILAVPLNTYVTQVLNISLLVYEVCPFSQLPGTVRSTQNSSQIFTMRQQRKLPLLMEAVLYFYSLNYCNYLTFSLCYSKNPQSALLVSRGTIHTKAVNSTTSFLPCRQPCHLYLVNKIDASFYYLIINYFYFIFYSFLVHATIR